MKITPKRKRSDSATAAVAAAQAVALGPLDPPAHVSLREGDRPFWDAVVTARARDTWTQTDLATAANLARTQADIEKLQAQLDREGYLTENGKLHPLAKQVEVMSRRVVALSRVLHVHAEAVVGRSRDAGNALNLEKQAAAEHDDLIPVLRVVSG